MSTIPEQVKHARELMHKAVESTKRELTTVRSGKAAPQITTMRPVRARPLRLMRVAPPLRGGL